MPRFAPPFDGRFDLPRLREVVRQQFGLGGSCGRVIEQCFGDAAVQNLAPAPQQILVGRVLDEGVFEAIICVRRQALHQQNVGVSELFEGGLQWRIFHTGQSRRSL